MNDDLIDPKAHEDANRRVETLNKLQSMVTTPEEQQKVNDAFLKVMALHPDLTPDLFTALSAASRRTSTYYAMELAKKALLDPSSQRVEYWKDEFRAKELAKVELMIEQGGGRQPMRPRGLSELRDLPEPEYVVDQLLLTDTTAFLAGQSSIGKSFLAVDMAVSVATGTPFQGLPTKQGKVLYIAGEGAAGLSRRIDAAISFRELTVPDDAIQVDDSRPMFADPECVSELMAVVKAGQFSLVILDTWSQLAGIENENDNAGAARVLASVARIREASPGCTALWIHHPSGENKSLRGATALKNNADTVIHAFKPDNSGDEDPFTISTFAHQGGKQKDALGFRMEGLTLRNTGKSAVVVRESASTFFDVRSVESSGVRRFQSAMDPTKVYSYAELRDLAMSCPMSKASAERAIKAAEEENVIEKLSRGEYRLRDLMDGLLGV